MDGEAAFGIEEESAGNIDDPRSSERGAKLFEPPHGGPGWRRHLPRRPRGPRESKRTGPFRHCLRCFQRPVEVEGDDAGVEAVRAPERRRVAAIRAGSWTPRSPDDEDGGFPFRSPVCLSAAVKTFSFKEWEGERG